MVSAQLSDRTSMSNSHSNGNNTENSSVHPSLRRPVAQNGAMPRPTSQKAYRPSYMSHVPATSQTESIAIDIPKASPRTEEPAGGALTPRGLLLILIADSVHPSTLDHLEILLGRQAFSGLVVAACQEQEVAVKKLKMDIFGLIGRMRKEIGVSVYLKDTLRQTGVESTVQEITRTGESLQGVLCCPGTGGLDGTDILKVDAEELEQSWRKSTAFLHTASRATMSLLVSQCKASRDEARNHTGHGPHGPFFLVADSSADTAALQITKSASNTLLQQLREATKPEGLVVGYTEDLLIPDPVQLDEPEGEIGDPFQERAAIARHAEEEPFVASESPTKLWNMWSNMQNDG